MLNRPKAHIETSDQMFTFKAKHGNKVQNIVLYRDLPLAEFFSSLQALQYTLDFPEGNILGFKDGQG